MHWKQMRMRHFVRCIFHNHFAFEMICDMNASFRRVVAMAVFLLSAAVCSNVQSAPLSYKFKAGQTNAYRVQLSSKSEGNPQRYEGVIIVGVREVEGDLATVFFGGTLKPQR